MASSMTFTLGNGTTEPLVTITITEVSLGVLNFSITQSGPIVGDLRGFFFDSLDTIVKNSLVVTNAQYTYANGQLWTLNTATELGTETVQSGEGSVKDLGSGANMNGALGTSGNGYDFGI